MIRFFDASALVKRYIREPGSDRVGRLLADGAAAVSRLSEAEVASALARRCREGDLTTGQRDRTLAALRSDLDRIYVVELMADVVRLTHGLLVRHSLRAGDALQLASCLRLQRGVEARLEFVGFDDRLNKAAEEEGLIAVGGG